MEALFAQHAAALEAELSDAVDHALSTTSGDPIMAVAEHLVRHEPISRRLVHLCKGVAALTSQLQTLPKAERASGVAELRACIVAAQATVDAAREGVESLVELATPTSRVGHLHTLEELIGPVPTDRTWQDEWESHFRERFGWYRPKQNAIQRYLMKQWVQEHITGMEAIGWPRARAEVLRLLMLGRDAFARALRDRDPCYAASTYALTDALFAQRGKHAAGRAYYRHLTDPTRAISTNAHSLSEDDAAWRTIETPDATGFRGLTCSSALFVGAGADAFVIDGFCDVKGSRAADSDVVRDRPGPTYSLAC